MSMDLILMGLPGAGKGTQAKKIVEHFNIPHISTGDIFRDAINNETKIGLVAKKYIDNGDLVPDSVTNTIVADRIAKNDVVDGYMLDGYPRTIEQAKSLDIFSQELNRPIDAVINIHVELDILIERISGRFVCSSCGAIYNDLYYRPKLDGTCDICGGHRFYRREDDKPKTVKNRLSINENMNKPIFDFYQQKGLFHTINGDQEINTVYSNIKNILDLLAAK